MIKSVKMFTSVINNMLFVVSPLGCTVVFAMQVNTGLCVKAVFNSSQGGSRTTNAQRPNSSDREKNILTPVGFEVYDQRLILL